MKILIHAYARPIRWGNKQHPKNYPYWSELVSLLQKAGHEVVQIGVEGEQQLVDTFHKNQTYNQMVQLVADCDLWIDIDSFLQHLGWYCNKHGIALFGQSDPLLFGHSENRNLLRDRRYLRKDQFSLWEEADYNAEAFVSAETVLAYVESLAQKRSAKVVEMRYA